MKKRTLLLNRAAPHSSAVNVKPAVLSNATLAHVKGAGNPQPPDLFPVKGNGDPGPTN
jgi:hypothetical protein